MFRKAFLILNIILWATVAFADVPLPQDIPAPAVPSGLAADGTLTSRLVNFTDLNFGTIYGAQSISTSLNTAQWGSAVYVLDSDPGYRINNTLQGNCLDDGISFVIGFITSLNSSSGSTVLTLDVTIAQGGSPCSNWLFQVINGPTNGIPPSQALALSTNSFALPVAGATLSITVDANKGYTAGSVIFVAALSDSNTWCWAIVQNYNSSTGALVSFVVQSSATGLTYANWTVGMNGTLAPFVPILGFSSTSLTFGAGAGQIAQGQVISLTTQTGLLLNNSHVVVSSSTDSTQYFRGIAQYTTGSGATTIYVTDASGSGNFSSWTLLAQDGPPVNASQIAVSTTSITLGSGDFTFTIQSGQNFPIQGPVAITALADQTKQMLGIIKAYSGTSLIVTVVSTGVYGSGTFAAWSIYNTSAPTTRISKYQQNNLRMTGLGTSTLTIKAGSIRNSTDAVDLVYSGGTISTTAGSTDFATGAAAGTVIAVTPSVVGTSTNFTGNFSIAATLTDLSDQLSTLGLAALTTPSIVTLTTGALKSSAVTAIADNTHMTTSGTLNAAGDTIVRGGLGTNVNFLYSIYGVYVAYKTSDGTIKAFATSFTPTGTPDLPAGYTYFRIIGYIAIDNSNQVQLISQPLITNVLTTAGDISYFGQTTLFSTNYQTYLQRLGIGAQYKTLHSDGSLPNWDAVHLDQAAAVTGALGAANGGSGVASPTAHSILQSEGASALNLITAATAGNIIVDQGAGADWLAKTVSGDATLAASGALTVTKINGKTIATSLIPVAIYSGLITPTAEGINVTVVDAVNDVVTVTAHSRTTGQAVILTGAVAAGLTSSTAYYINALTANTLALYTTQKDAYADTNRVNITATTTGWSFRYLAYTTTINQGFDTVAPVGGFSNAATTLHWDFNLLTSAGATTNCLIQQKMDGIPDTVPTVQNFWISQGHKQASGTDVYVCSNANLISYTGNIISASSTSQGTWANQGTAAWYHEVWVWSQ